MKKLIAYINSAYDELVNKVSWPTWEELQESTILVVISSLIFSLVVYGTDVAVSKVLGVFYDLIK